MGSPSTSKGRRVLPASGTLSGRRSLRWGILSVAPPSDRGSGAGWKPTRLDQCSQGKSRQFGVVVQTWVPCTGTHGTPRPQPTPPPCPPPGVGRRAGCGSPPGRELCRTRRRISRLRAGTASPTPCRCSDADLPRWSFRPLRARAGRLRDVGCPGPYSGLTDARDRTAAITSSGRRWSMYLEVVATFR